MRKDLPEPPTLSEPVLQNLPPPTDPREFGKWAQNCPSLRNRERSCGGRKERKRRKGGIAVNDSAGAGCGRLQLSWSDRSGVWRWGVAGQVVGSSSDCDDDIGVYRGSRRAS